MITKIHFSSLSLCFNTQFVKVWWNYNVSVNLSHFCPYFLFRCEKRYLCSPFLKGILNHLSFWVSIKIQFYFFQYLALYVHMSIFCTIPYFLISSCPCHISPYFHMLLYCPYVLLFLHFRLFIYIFALYPYALILLYPPPVSLHHSVL